MVHGGAGDRSARGRPDVRLEGVGYAYRGVPALRGLSAEVAVGVTGILGPNGAGKSTLLRLLAGLELAHEGVVRFDGAPVVTHADASRLRESVGYLPQDPRWSRSMSVHDLVRYFAVSWLGRSGAVRVADAIDAVGLSDRRDTPIGRLSGGQARRAFLAQALVHDPSILVLDEPTAGLDPVQRVRLRQHVLATSGGRAVVWATHIVDDLLSLADRILVLDEGRLVWSGPPHALEELGASADRDDGMGDGMSAGECGFLAVLARVSARREEQ